MPVQSLGEAMRRREFAMRWTLLFLPILGLIGLSDPAHSTRFQCQFFDPDPWYCPRLLDTSDENKRGCSFVISPTLTAACQVRPVDATNDWVICGFAHPQALETALNEAFRLSEALRASGELSIATASEQPGFMASSSYYASATSRYLTAYSGPRGA
jgi:hypothetical protein